MVSETHVVNSKERQSRDALITYDAFVSRDRLIAAIFDAVAGANDRGDAEFLSRHVRSLLGVDRGGRTAAIEEKIAERFAKYDAFVDRVAVTRRQALVDIAAWMNGRGFTQPRGFDDVAVVCADPLFHAALRYSGNVDIPSIFVGGEFDSKAGSVYISYDERMENPDALRTLVVHELGHALSCDPVAGAFGFRQYGADGILSGNLWLDEGAAVIFEKEFQNEPDGVRAPEDPLYDGYAWTAEVLLKKIGATKEEFLEAWLSGGAARKLFEEKIRVALGCAIADLDVLFLGYDDESKKKIVDILDGKTVLLEAVKGSGLDTAYRKLQTFFPAVDVRIVDPPVMAQ